VDDEPSIIVAIQFLMEQNGYETIVAFSGEEAMEAVAKHRPDLVLLDIMLPVVTGSRCASGCARTLAGRTSASCC